jgi:hypothetical protein
MAEDFDKELKNAAKSARRKVNNFLNRAENKVGRNVPGMGFMENEPATRMYQASIRSQIDPTRNRHIPDMSMVEKEEYFNELKAFNARSNKIEGFVRDADNVAIPKANWDAFKSLEKQVNAFVAQDMERYEHVPMPEGAMTMGDWMTHLRNDPKYIGANASGTQMYIREYESTDIVYANIGKLEASMLNKLDKKYIRDRTFGAREQFEKMAQVIGDEELMQDARELTDYQFWGMWNYTDFANSTSLVYLLMMKDMKGKPSGMSAQAVDQITEAQMGKVKLYVEWARQI